MFLLKLTDTAYTEHKYKLENGFVSISYEQTDVQFLEPLKNIPPRFCCYEREIKRLFDFNKNYLLSDLHMCR